ncbi:MAG TPA: glycoside hydrolase family 2 TIM barrel-domain containing protein, partial [Chloroflexota bacterium]
MPRAEDDADGLTAAALRADFARGLSAGSAARLLEARDAGLGWEEASQAVAAGLAECYGAVVAAPQRAVAPADGVKRAQFWGAPLAVMLSGVLLYIALRPGLGLGHEVLVAGLAWVAHWMVGSGLWEPAVRVLGLDPIYTGAAIRALGGVQVAGLAVAEPLGEMLHATMPGLFLDPGQVADGAGVSMVALPGAPALGRALAAFGADVVCLAVGLWLFWRWRRTNWRIALLGLLIQAQIAVNHLFDAEVRLADVDASGLPFALALAMPNIGWFTSGLHRLSTEARDLLTGSVLTAAGYACAVALLGLAALVTAPRRIRRPSQRRRAPSVSDARRPGVLAPVSLGLALLTAWSPIGALAVGESNWQATASPSQLALRDLPRPTGGGRSRSVSHTVRLAGSTRVSVAQGPAGDWQYLVDGEPDTIRGVGYNPQYASLTPAARATLYQRDFGDMRRLGINTIEGWFEGQFDSITLDNAARSGIGVLMPFELNQDWDFTDATVRASILDRVSAYVDRYKSHPAVRMWAPGNENLHRILYAHWVSQENVPAARARAAAFAAFLPTLVDRIHALDPDHPVIYRDAEDVYLNWLVAALAKDGVDRPWLVYGANVYSTARLQQIVTRWPAQWPGRPLVISEFAPGGVGPAERPLGFQQQWAMIRARSATVLGGLAYTWATNGPEDLDRVFGLVDASGAPTDGALAAL